MKPRRSNRFRSAALTSFGFAMSLCVAHATIYTWDADGTSPANDGSGTWGLTGTNWLNGTTSVFGAWGNTTADTAVFGVGSGAAGTITVGAVTANALTFNAAGSGNYTLTGGTITLGGTNPTITANVNARIDSTISSTVGNTYITGAATLTLGGTCAFTDTTLPYYEGGFRRTVLSNTTGSIAVVTGANITAKNFSLWQDGVTNGNINYDQTGGTVNVTGVVGAGGFGLGGSGAGGNSGCTNTATISGGTLTAAEVALYKWATCVLNVSNAGVVNATSLRIGWGDSSPTGTINVGDGSTFSGGTSINDGGASGVLNVNAWDVRSNRSYTLNFKGGALKAGAAGTSWLTANAFTNANVQDAGGIIDNGGFGITIAQVLSHGGVAATDGGLVFKGSGSTTLSGTNSYTGQTTINAGTLNLTGVLGNSAVTVKNAATLSGEGTIGATGSLSFDSGSTLRIDSSTTAALTVGSGNTGNVTLNGATNVVWDPPSTPTGGSATYRVLNYFGTLSGGVNFSASGYRNAIFDTATANQVNLTVDTYALTWTGSASGVWDIGGATNWSSSSPNQFYNGDAVTFGDGPTQRAVTLGSTVLPASVSFTNTSGNDYTLSGSGSIAGSSTLNVTGTGTVSISTSNSYTGVTTINNGVLAVTSITNGGVAGGLGAATNAAANLVLNGGTLRFYGVDASTTDRNFTLGTNGGTLDASGSSAIIFTGAPTMAGTDSARTLTLTGSNTGDNTLQGIVGNNGTGATSLLKTGAGKWLLTGSNTYSGTTTINNGTLLSTKAAALPGYNTASKIAVASGATLAVRAGGTGEWSSAEVDSLLGATTAAFVSGSKFGIDVSSPNSFTYANNIGATQAAKDLVKSGAGTLILTGSNTYTGTTTINGGTLQIGSGGTVGSLGTGAVVNNAALVFNQTTLTINNAISGSGSVSNTGATGTLTLAQNIALTNNNFTFASVGGTINTGVNLSVGSGTGTFTSVSTGSGSLNIVGTHSFSASGGGSINLSGTVATTGGGNAGLSLGGTTLTTSGNVNLSGKNTGEWGINYGASASITATSGTTTLTGDTTNNGAGKSPFLFINNPAVTLTANSGAAIVFQVGAASGTGNYMFYDYSNGTVFNTSGNVTFRATSLNSTNVFWANNPTFNVATGGALTLDAGGTNMSNGLKVASSGASVTIAGSATGTMSGTMAVNAGSLIYNISGSGALTQSGVVSGAGSLYKLGAGTLTLSATNTYTSGTTVGMGTLSLTNASASTGGAITMGDANTGSNQVTLNLNSANNNGATVSGAVTNNATNAAIAGYINFSSAAASTFNLAANTNLTLSNTYGYINNNYYSTINGSGTLTVVGNLFHVGNQSDTSTLVVGNAATVYAGVTGGMKGALVINAGGKFTNNNVHVFSGGASNTLWINGGTLQQGGSEYYLPVNLQMTGGSLLGGDTRFSAGAHAITINASPSTAIINAGVRIYTGGTMTIGVADGAAAVDLEIKHTNFGGYYDGGATNLIKNGAGLMEYSAGTMAMNGLTTVNAGTLRLTGLTSFSGTGITTTASTGSVVQLNAANSLDNLLSPAATYTINTGTTLSKIGPGKIRFAPTNWNSNAGNVTVENGTLYVNNTKLAAQAVTVNGGFLGGSGSVGNTTVATGAGIEGGSGSNGSLTLANLTYSGSGNAQGYLGASTPFIVTGAVTASGGANSISITALNLPSDGTYHFLSYGSGTNPFTAFKFTQASRNLTLVDNSANKYIDITVSSTAYPIWTGLLSGEWSANTLATPKNWVVNVGGTTDFLLLDNVLFDDTATGTTDILVNSGNVQPGSTTFNNSTLNYTLSGSNSITTGALTKNGSGTLTIHNVNTFTGATLDSGTLIVGNNNAINSLATSALTINGGTLQASGAITLPNNYSVTADFALTGGASGLTLAGTGNLGTGTRILTVTNDVTLGGTLTVASLLKSGTGTLALNAANTFTGSTTISQGTLSLGNTTAVGTGAITLGDANTGSNNITLSANVGGGTFSNPITVSASGTGTVTISQPQAYSALTGLLTLNRATRITQSGDRSSISGKITGNVGTLNFSGNRITMDQTQANASDFIGNVIIDGTVQMNTTYGLPSTASVTVNAGAYFRTIAGSVINGLNGGGKVNNDSSGGAMTTPLSLGNNGGSGSFSGTLENGSGSDIMHVAKNGAGTQTFSGTGIIYTGATTINNGTLKLTDTTAFNSSSVIMNGGTLELERSTGTWAFSKAITAGTGTGNLVKSGDGTVTLTNTNTYNGTTTVKAGTLALGLNGSIANSTSIVVGDAGFSNAMLDTTAKAGFTIESTQTLSGIGTVKVGTDKTLTINGTHAAGNSAGVQIVDGNLAYGSSSIFAWDLNSGALGTRGDAIAAGGYDGVNVSGTLSGTTGATFRVILGSGAFEDPFWNTSQTWNGIFAQADGTTPISFQSVFSNVEWFEGTTNRTGFTSTQGSFSISGSTLTWTAVPEPTSALAGLLLGAGLLRRRRK